jgi:membrane protease YdiL (CAAX protease family)
LFFAVPVAYARGLIPLPILPTLWLVSGVCLIALIAAPGFDRRELWNAADFRSRVKWVLIPLLIAAPLLVLLTFAFAPDRLFGFVRARPGLWAVVMVLYPVLSAYPQGLVYRTFIFHRYSRIFPTPSTRILGSAMAFSAVHIVFENWLAPVLSLFGGVLFAWTYERTRSSLVTTLQHAAFGCLVFTVGLGQYFYHGATRAGG